MNTRRIMPAALVVTLALAGCPQPVVVDEEPVSQPLAVLQEEPPAVVEDDQDDRERLLVAWLVTDQDQDGLSNGIELEFGLDPLDPTDGPDIDGDGIPNYRDDDVDGDGVVNETDPDIDGDEIPNDRDRDVDGDAIPNEIDFDIDGDGIRNQWDLDADSNGQEDAGPFPVSDDLAGEFLDRVQAALEGEDDADDDDHNSRFEAYVAHLVRRGAKGDASAREDLKRLLDQINRGGRRPIEPDSHEAKLIVGKLADRFESDNVDKIDKGDVEIMLVQLMVTRPTPSTQDKVDATDALDALFRQVTEIKNPEGSEAAGELRGRIDGVKSVAGAFSDADLPACSEAVSKLVDLPGEGSLAEKVEAVVELERLIEETDLDAAVGFLVEFTEGLEDRIGEKWEWSVLVKVIKESPGFADGIDSDEVDETVEAVVEESNGSDD